MQMARALGLPVHKVYSYGEHHENGRVIGSILMEAMPGEMLDEVHEGMTPEEKETVAAELKHYLGIMRSYSNPWGTTVCSVIGGSLYSTRTCPRIFVPCDDEAAFNTFLHYCCRPTDEGYHGCIPFKEAQRRAHLMDNMPHQIVFTHGDLWSHNILVKDGHITAIIDWETAGWYPEYWEITTPQRWQSPDSFWPKTLKFITDDKYAEEFQCEIALWELSADAIAGF
ncbi:hypothetical protein SERLA73DRAFT_63256 [Serpula lacrymans var. lacrymans S7.3]|uniref:Aminoglycoside phosphotransferase domain-containing protein n=2 Tax=Serpula lacrymans var. lacrymans TaxID=341189 RepID=F8QCN8_SERL3|nr:hypothetical protein SERLA73DRAFT_63256 [Serpula lacrymans var. lacrymans S7.3]